MTRGDNCVQIQRSKEVDLLKKRKKEVGSDAMEEHVCT